MRPIRPFRILLPSFALLALAGCATLRAEAATNATTGELKTAVVLVNFSDNTAQPKTKAEVHALVFGQTSDYFWEASYQKTFLGGDTYGWFTMPFPGSQCSWPKVAEEGNRAAAAAGADLSAYDQVVYMYPQASGCVSGGGGDIAANGQRQVFISGTAGFAVTMLAHEMGHGLGLLHSDALDCDATPLGNACVVRNYTDTADTMGSDGHFNAFQKERLGWLDGSGTPTITTVAASGRYAIQPYETATAGAKALKILKSTDPATGQKTWYYVEYRQAIGYDVVLANRGNMTTGVQVRTGTVSPNGVATSLLLDMTPNSHSWIGVDFEDGALGVGRTFTDPASGVSITLAAADANGATIDVSVAGAAPAPPPPATPGTLTDAVGTNKTLYARGETVAMSALVKRDGVAVAGATVKFTLAMPNGATTLVTATSGSDGYARGSYRIAKAKSAIGAWTLRADATHAGASATASSTFSVR